MIKEYSEFCYEQVGNYGLKYIDYFEGLRPQLIKAGIDVSLPEYVSMMFFTSAALGIASLIFFSLILLINSGIAGLFMGIILGIVATAGSFLGLYLLPTIKMSDRASRIDDTLPFAIMYLSTLAGTGTSIAEMFSNLSKSEEYGELAKEAEKIHRDMEVFGMDITEALHKGAERSPSEDLEEVLWGMNHVLTTGGSLREFLNERAEALMDDYMRRVEEFSNQLGLLVQMYIIIVIVGSIIFTSMGVVMGTIGGINTNTIVFIQLISVFVGLPLISGLFIILIDGISPGGIQ